MKNQSGYKFRYTKNITFLFWRDYQNPKVRLFAGDRLEWGRL